MERHAKGPEITVLSSHSHSVDDENRFAKRVAHRLGSLAEKETP